MSKRDDKRSRLTKAYDEGRKNREADKSGLNPYPEEGQRWYDYEFGWGEADYEIEELGSVTKCLT